MPAFDLDALAAELDGKFLDLDAAPRQHPWQCHDVFLALVLALGGKLTDGHAPGTEYTDQVWRAYPRHRPNLARLFTRHGPEEIRRGDAVFWSSYAGAGGLPHVAIALEDARANDVLCLTQNPDRVRRARLTRTGVLGVLRPITTQPTPTTQKKDEEDDMATKERVGLYYTEPSNGWIYYVIADTDSGLYHRTSAGEKGKEMDMPQLQRWALAYSVGGGGFMLTTPDEAKGLEKACASVRTGRA